VIVHITTFAGQYNVETREWETNGTAESISPFFEITVGIYDFYIYYGYSS
jgi:hypothetical protein